jgi:hypothetical protein
MLTIRNQDVVRTVWQGMHREQRKPATKQGVLWISDLDLGQFLFRWVVEGAIKVMARSMSYRTESYLKR